MVIIHIKVPWNIEIVKQPHKNNNDQITLLK